MADVGASATTTAEFVNVGGTSPVIRTRPGAPQPPGGLPVDTHLLQADLHSVSGASASGRRLRLTATGASACVAAMLPKLVLGVAVSLFLARIFFRRQLRGLGTQLDRLVNATIIAFVLTYVIIGLYECSAR